jgi:recombinational DNA repair protein (RecF pathway)
METFQVFELNDKKCMTCGRQYNHRKVYYKTAEGLKEVEFLHNCATCRSILRRKKEIDFLLEERKTLAKNRLNDDWENFVKVLNKEKN